MDEQNVHDEPSEPVAPAVPEAGVQQEASETSDSAPTQAQEPQQTALQQEAATQPYEQQPYAQAYAQPQPPQQPPYGQVPPQQQYAGAQSGPYAQQQGVPYGQPQYAQPQAGPYAQQPYAQAQPQYVAYGMQGQPLIVGNKNKVLAAVLAFFLGGFGVHNFYLGRTGRGIAQLLMCTIGWLLIIPPFIAGIWAFVEFILILVAAPGTTYHQDAQGFELQD
ncbi:TM2 domain-containing protein [Alloscardovia macacae]|uniref:TM2 domain-containing protein n=1 Tax=Alloscardovia macacae TaxID=1160091 RepID=A0A261F4X7_9BIFI|nr:TM2 domain-containing protein [Alloscardovia macacae]OZG54148.1 TM2 domain-containing protein [Alloscardovia macacae]